MKFVNGLYLSLVLIMLVFLTNTTIFNDAYSGIAMFVSLIIFLAGNICFINAKQFQKQDERN